MDARGVLGGVTAEIEAIANGGDLRAVGEEEVHRGGEVDAQPLAFAPDDGERAHDGVDELVALGHRVRVAQPGEDERVDPFAVGGAADVAGEGGRDMRGEGGLELGERARSPLCAMARGEPGNWNGCTLASEMSTAVE